MQKYVPVTNIMPQKFLQRNPTPQRRGKKKVNSKSSLRSAIAPLWLLSSAIGIAPRRHDAKWPSSTTILLLITSVALFKANTVYQTKSTTVKQLLDEPWLIPRLVMFLFERSIMTVALCVNCLTAPKNFRYIFENLSLVDRYLYSSHDPPDYDRIKFIVRIITCTLIASFIIFAAIFLWSVNATLLTTPLYFLQRVTILINDTTVVQYLCIVLFARSRFVRLSHVVGRRDIGIPSISTGPRSRRTLHDAESIVRAYHSLCEVTDTANSNYGCQILLYVGFLSLSIVSYVFKLIAFYRVTGSEENKVGLSAMWMSKNSLMFVGLLAACHATRDSGRESARRVTGCLLAFGGETWRWGLVLAESRPAFNACGFFALDLSLLLHVGATATTYVIILLQN